MLPQPGSTQHKLVGPAAGEPVGVLVVDDQVVFRQVAHEVIDATDEFELLGEASSGAHALLAASELDPDLVILDVRMPEMDGIETAERLRAEHPRAVVVLITVEEASQLPGGTSSCGAAELVRKQDFGPALLRRLWEAHRPQSSRPDI
jgi:DNA-binding NarL/FixJ family response regulator